MKRLDEEDEASMKVWWWLRTKIEDGLLLSICLAVLEEDLETLETISIAHFARGFGIGEVSSITCNQILHSLGLHEALIIGYLNTKVSRCEHSAMALMCQEQKSRLNLRGQGEGYNRTYAVLQRAQVLPESALAGLRLALIAAVEANLAGR